MVILFIGPFNIKVFTLSVVVAGIIRCPVDVIVKLFILKLPLAGNVYVVVNGFGNEPSLSTKQYLLSQETWRTYVIADCRMQTDAYLGGSFAQVVQFSCPVQKAKARVDELVSIIH